MNSPARLRILGRNFKIIALPTDSPNLGEALVDEGKLAIRDGLDKFTLQDTVLHETMHAIRHQQGHEYGDAVEEDYVRSLATGLLGVLHDNPSFAKWLISKP